MKKLSYNVSVECILYVSLSNIMHLPQNSWAWFWYCLVMWILGRGGLCTGLPWWRKESACSSGDLGSIPGLRRSPGGGHGNPLHYSCLENPMYRGPGGLQSMRSPRVGHDWATKHVAHTGCSPGLCDSFLFFNGRVFCLYFARHGHLSYAGTVLIPWRLAKVT